MTREAAIAYIKTYRKLDEDLHNTAPKDSISYYATDKCLKYWDMAIQALSQEPCTDAVSRRKAISVISACDGKSAQIEALEQLPSVNPQPCDDAISREWLKTAIHNFYYGLKHTPTEEDIQAYIDAAPPVTPSCDKCAMNGSGSKYCDNCGQKSGKWIEHPEIETNAPEYLMFYECSECGDKPCFCKSDIHKKRFCSNCGARMVESQESEDKE